MLFASTNYASGNSGNHSCLTLIFGLGLVGKALVATLEKRIPVDTQILPFDWNDHNVRKQHAKNILDACSKEILKAPSPPIVNVVWAAGSGGFSASDDDLLTEWESYTAVLKTVEKIENNHPDTLVRFHLMSSAGGLFENVRFVDQQTAAAAERPYTRNKLRQEKATELLKDAAEVYIYRLSSVYGYVHGGRMGLIPALIRNGLSGATTTITGKTTTLRDYILVEDICRFVVERMVSENSKPGTYFMVSGKPTSLIEIVENVELVMNRSLLLKFDLAPNNAAHISFRPSITPPDLHITPLSTGIRQTFDRIKQL